MVISTLKLKDLVEIFSEEISTKVLIFDYERTEISSVFVHMDFLNLLLGQKQDSSNQILNSVLVK